MQKRLHLPEFESGSLADSEYPEVWEVEGEDDNHYTTSAVGSWWIPRQQPHDQGKAAGTDGLDPALGVSEVRLWG